MGDQLFGWKKDTTRQQIKKPNDKQKREAKQKRKKKKKKTMEEVFVVAIHKNLVLDVEKQSMAQWKEK